ncbi:hypothetical protein TMatcc_005540 [Talaromyces marneffei ATCC 18224]|nr:uncharacterized protein EYB26_005927 [Talaromyces marneffei]KAE8554904.1 hypothetical protein EYB25_003451 [Talaromyces marneffei]QGA18243.1 hypothetical protein EYB26_005927 [Talaromyces marneffei]
MASPNDSRLCHLPTEILIEIIKLLPSFSSLWSLINAFPRFNSIFLSVPFEIFEHFLRKETPPCIQALMRVALVARISPSWFADRRDVTKYMSRYKTFDHYFDALSERTKEPELALKVALVVRDMVETAHKIHAVAHACLDYYVEKSMTIKPECWHDGLPSFDHSKLGNQPEGRPIQPKPSGPPTYLEEQILIRLLWRLQVFIELRTANRQKNLEHWSEDNRRSIQIWFMDYLFHAFTPISNTQEMFRTYNDTWNPYCEKDQFSSLMEFVIHVTAGDTKLKPGLWELENFLKNLPPKIYDGCYHATCLPPKPISETRRGLMTTDDILPATVSIDEMIEKPPAGWRLHDEMVSDRRHHYSSVPFEPYRRYGFAFWQAERMANLGFDYHERPGFDESDAPKRYFVWHSVLRGVDMSSRYGHPHEVTQ